METKKCPFCNEEINIKAIKCKHCKEFLTNNPSSSSETIINNEEPIDNSVDNFLVIFKAMFCFIAAWLLFYFGSWQIVWDQKISIIDQFFLGTYSLKAQDVILLEPGFVFKFNDSYYGFSTYQHFFNSPFIQCIMLFLSIVAFFEGLIQLIDLKLSRFLKFVLFIFIFIILFKTSIIKEFSSKQESITNKNDISIQERNNNPASIKFNIEQSKNGEDFNAFINHFISDSLFQKSRTNKPFISSTGLIDDRIETKEWNLYYMTNEVIYEGEKKVEGTLFYGRFIKNSPTKIFYNCSIPESDVGTLLTFELIHSKWMLVEFHIN